MKRLMLVLFVLVVAAGSAFLFLSRSEISEGTQLVSAETVFYASVPDVRRTVERWPQTALAQIAAEPSVSAFLRKPLSIAAGQGGLEAADLLLQVKPARFFAAVSSVREDGADVLLGFEFYGGRENLDRAMDRLHRELGKSLPGAEKKVETYEGDTLTSFGPAGRPVLFSGIHGRWGVVSNSLAAVKQSLDRASGRNKSPNLSSNADYQRVMSNLSKDPDMLWFGRLQPIVDVLLAVGQRQQAPVDAEQLAQIRKIAALGGTLAFAGAEQKEATFVLMEGAPKLPVISRSPMSLTTPSTTFFYDATLDWSVVSKESYVRQLPPVVQQFLGAAQIDLTKLPLLFGSDSGAVIHWSQSSMVPSVLAVLEVRDRAAVAEMANRVIQNLGVNPVVSRRGEAQVFGFPMPQIPLLDPAIAIDDRFLYLSLTGEELNRALAIKPGAATLEGSPAFHSALPAYRSDVQGFCYLDSKSLFEGIYNRVRPIAIFAAAMSADIGKYVDVDKLPETEAISRHLTPILYTTMQKSDGWLIESSGPVTLSQALFGTMIGAGAFYGAQSMGGMPR